MDSVDGEIDDLSLDGDDDGELMLDSRLLHPPKESTLTPAQHAPPTSTRRRRKHGFLLSTKKPSDAPKRFKSSFIFFSMEKHMAIKEAMKSENGPKVKNITKAVAEAWRSLSPEERDKYEDMARRDKERYDLEKANYIPPPGMSLTSKRPREPNAPRRPMSAYLCFANARRGAVKAQNPDCSNGEISRLLSEMWKNTPDSVKKPFKDEELAKWEAYKQGMVEWRKMNNKKKKLQTKRSEEDGSPFDVHGDIGRPKKKQIKSSDDDFGNIDSESGFDVQLGLQAMDSHGNPNPEEMMAASTLRGVRGGPQMMGIGIDTGHVSHPHGGYGTWCNNLTSTNSGMNGFNSVVGSVTGSAGRSFNQMDMPQFSSYNQFGNYSTIGTNNPQGMMMAQLRGTANPYQPQYPGNFLTSDQQPNLSQLASLAGSQHNSLDQTTGLILNNNIGSGTLGAMLNDNSSGSLNNDDQWNGSMLK
ncbi:high mobility group box domain containing protein [Nitzschia inconspicua]|uniref:High mobility group box domain containing protein n=1 Tax=Nitzschia inconspicua TaxID=303405 RepID=A0A9K3PYJ4_9STRA|nr:high mobility group box domain containing protein [Nitzschia inconspicua]